MLTGRRIKAVTSLRLALFFPFTHSFRDAPLRRKERNKEGTIRVHSPGSPLTTDSSLESWPRYARTLCAVRAAAACRKRREENHY
jgi:hypothetical protein